MTFDEVLSQLQDLPQREKRVSYRGLKRRFALLDEQLLGRNLERDIAKWYRGAVQFMRHVSVLVRALADYKPQSVTAREAKRAYDRAERFLTSIGRALGETI